MNGMKRLLVGLLTAAMLISAVPMSAITVQADSSIGSTVHVHELEANDGWHSLMDNAYYVDEPITSDGSQRINVFCFDHSKAWPNDESVDFSYDNSMLSPNQAAAREAIRRVLYAGCGNNGAGLFDENGVIIGDPTSGFSMDVFKEKLNSPSKELKDYLEQELGYVFPDNGLDITNNEEISSFAYIVYSVLWDYSHFESEECYDAWFALAIAHGENADEDGMINLNDSSTQEILREAMIESLHSATQSAIWWIESTYRLGANESGYSGSGSPQCNLLYKFATDPDMIKKYPIPSEAAVASDFNNTISLNDGQDDIHFSKAADGKWHSQTLKLEGQKTGENELMYKTVFDVNYDGKKIQTVLNDEEFEIILDDKPDTAKTISFSSKFKWPSEIYLYSPPDNVEYFGKKYQRMGGMYLRDKTISTTNYALSVENYGSLRITKQVEGKEAPDYDFEFTVDLSNLPAGYMKSGSYLNAVVDGNNTKVKCESTGDTTGRLYDITLKAGQSIEIEDLPNGAQYTVNEALPKPVDNWAQSYDKNRTGTISSNNTSATTVKNHYSKTYADDKAAKRRFTGQKQIKDLIQDEEHPDYMSQEDHFNKQKFSFLMYPMTDDSPMPAGCEDGYQIVQNADDGTITFGEITFNRVGTYHYFVEEVLTYDIEEVSNDIHHWEIKVNVTEGSDGKLVAYPSYERHHRRFNSGGMYCENETDYSDKIGGPLTFVNTRSRDRMSVLIKVEKMIDNQLQGLNLSKEGYEFTITPAVVDPNKYPEGANKEITIQTSKSGEASSPEIVLTKEWFDANCGDNSDTITLDYNVKEVKGNVPGITYSTTTAKATIHAQKISHKDDGGQDFTDYRAWVTYSNDDLKNRSNDRYPLVFTNTYNPEPVNAHLYVQKAFDYEGYKPLNGEKYEFAVKAGTADAPEISDITLTADGYGNFVQTGGNSKSKFTKTGSYEYIISEKDAGKTYSLHGGEMTNTNEKWKATVTIRDNGLGNLEVASVYYEKLADSTRAAEGPEAKALTQAVFTNSYRPMIKTSLLISKAIIGREWKSDDSFDFEIKKVFDSENQSNFDPIAAAGEARDEAEDAEVTICGVDEHKNKSARLVMDEAGTYYYLINEKSANSSTDLVYDKRTFVAEYRVVASPHSSNALIAYPVGLYETNGSWDDRRAVHKVAFENKTEDAGASINGCTLTIGNQISINYYISGANDTTINSYKMKFTRNGDTTSQTYEESKKLTRQSNGETLYGFTFSNIYAYQMGETVTAELYLVKDDKEYFLGSKDYSIRYYADTLVDRWAKGEGNNANQKLYEMLRDMLNYGAAAQEYAADSYGKDQPWISETGDLVNSKLSSEMKGLVDKVTPNSNDEPEISEGATDKITDVSVSLVANENMNMSMKVAFRLNDPDASKYKAVIVSGVNDNLTSGNKTKVDNELVLDSSDFRKNYEGRYVVMMDRIPPFFWNYKYTLKFTDENNEVVYSLKYSINSYIYRKLTKYNNDTERKLAKLLKAMYRYQETASIWWKK